MNALSIWYTEILLLKCVEDGVNEVSERVRGVQLLAARLLGPGSVLASDSVRSTDITLSLAVRCRAHSIVHIDAL